MRLARSSVRFRMCATLVLSVIPPILLLVFIGAQWRRHEIIDAQAQALMLARHFSAIYERETDGAHSLLDRVARAARSARADSELKELLAQALRDRPQFDTLGILLPAGQSISLGRPPADGQRDLPNHPVFRRALETGRFAVGARTFVPADKRLTVTFALPTDPAGARNAQIVFAVIDLGSVLQHWILELAAAEPVLLAGTAVNMFDADGMIVAAWPDPAPWVGRLAPQDPVVSAARANNREGWLEATSLDAVRRVFAFVPLRGRDGGGDLYLAVGIPADVATAQADRALWWDVGIFAVVLVVGLIGGAAATNRFVIRPVQAIIDTTNRLKEGDLNARTDASQAPREFRPLATAIDGMADAWRRSHLATVKARDELATEARLFRAMVDLGSTGTILLDRQGQILFASLAAARLFGCPVGDLVGRSLKTIVHPDDRENLTHRLADVARAPAAPVVVNFRAETPARSWASINVTLRNLLDQPEVGAIVGTCRGEAETGGNAAVERWRALQGDVVDESWAVRALDKLSRAIEQTADSVLITDRVGVIEYVNPAFEAMTGFTRDEAIGKTPRILRSGAQNQKFYETLWSTVLAGRTFRAVMTNRRQDGRLYDEDQTISPIRDARGDITHFVSTGRDITQRKRTEEALRRLNQQLETEATRIAGILHDEAGQFLTSAHITLADVSRDVPPQVGDRLQEVRWHLDHVEERLRHMSHEMHPRVVQDLGLREAVAFFANAFTRRTGIPVTIESSLDRRYPLQVETLLYRVVQEGLTNMSRHAQAKNGSIVLSGDEEMVRCSVRDDGVGFDVPAMNARGAGSLGLRLMEDRLEAVGGSLTIISAPGQGTELRATLPVEV